MSPLRALLLAGGPAPPAAFVRSCYRPGDLVIAADGGLDLAREAGLKADLLVGDLDSLASELASGLDAGLEIQRHPIRKDASDLELALEEGARRGATRALVLGALGGRLDHTLFNVVALLEKAIELGVPTLLAEPTTEVFLAGPGGHEVLDRLGWNCSALPLDRQARLTLKGMEYPLEAEVLSRASTRGLSNRILTSPAFLEVHQGRVLVVLTQA